MSTSIGGFLHYEWQRLQSTKNMEILSHTSKRERREIAVFSNILSVIFIIITVIISNDEKTEEENDRCQ